jgi:hypothetical protein
VDRSSGLYGHGPVIARLCRMPSWNDFGFAMTLNNYDARTEPVNFAGRDPAARGIAEPCSHYRGGSHDRSLARTDQLRVERAG